MADTPDFVKGAAGGAAYDTSPYGLGIAPTYLGGATATAGSSGTGGATADIVWSAATSRAGSVACNGATYDGTDVTYLALWNAIGTTYGGSGQAAFQVPDLRGRVMVDLGTHADVSTMGNNDGVAVANRRPKHNSTNSLTLPNHIHSHALTGTISDPAVKYVGGGSTGPRSGGFGDDPQGTSVTIGGAIGNPTTNPAIDGTIGPSGTNPVDAPAYLVLKAFIVL